MASEVGSPTTATSGRTPSPGSAASTASVPSAGVLLVGDEGEHDAAGGSPAGELLGGHDHRRDAALHVARAAPGEPVPVDGRGERVGHAVDTDGVEVAGQDDGGAGRCGGADGDQARAVVVPRGHDDVGGEAAALQPVSQVLDDRGLTGGPGTRPGFTESMATSSAVSATAAAPRRRRRRRRSDRRSEGRLGRSGRRRGRRWPPGDPTPGPVRLGRAEPTRVGCSRGCWGDRLGTHRRERRACG